MESVEIFKNLKKRMYEALVSDEIIDKWAKTHVWQTEVGGNVVDVYPVIIWDDCIDLKTKTNRNYFAKAIERIVNTNEEFERGVFSNGLLRFYFTESFSKEVTELRKNINAQIEES